MNLFGKILFGFAISLFVATAYSQGFRENYYEKIFETLTPEYKEIMSEAELSISQGIPFENEGMRFRALAETQELKQDSSTGEKLNDLIKRENKLFKKSTEKYAVAADLYLEAAYIKYNIYSKTLKPLEIKSKGEKRKKMLAQRKDAELLYSRANFTMAKARKTDRLRPRYEYYRDAITLALQALNKQAEEFKIYYEWTD